jgi:DNA-binding MarR family transcriptional regulator
VTASDLSLLFDLFIVNQRVRRALAITMADSPLDPVEYAIYSLIMEEGPDTPTGFAQRAGMPTTTFLDHLHDMDGRGHIVKAPNPSDGRSYLVELSAAGLAAQSAANPYFDSTIRRILAALPIEEGTARTALAALAHAADTALDEIEPKN